MFGQVITWQSALILQVLLLKLEQYFSLLLLACLFCLKPPLPFLSYPIIELPRNIMISLSGITIFGESQVAVGSGSNQQSISWSSAVAWQQHHMQLCHQLSSVCRYSGSMVPRSGQWKV